MAVRKRGRSVVEAGLAPPMALLAHEPTAVEPDASIPSEPVDAAPLEPPAPGPDSSPSAAMAHLAQGELSLAAAVLLPCLDTAIDPACRHAAALIRVLMQDFAPPEAVPSIPDDLMAGALLRLAAQIRVQERQIERLHALLARAA